MQLILIFQTIIDGISIINSENDVTDFEAK